MSDTLHVTLGDRMGDTRVRGRPVYKCATAARVLRCTHDVYSQSARGVVDGKTLCHLASVRLTH